MASEPLKHTRSGSMVQNVAGRPEPDSGPEPDLPAVWISPQTHQKYTVVYSELIRSLLATSYASLTIIGTSDVRGWYLIRGRTCPPNGYLLKYTKSTRAYTVQITFIFIGQTHLFFGKRVCTCVTKHSNAFRTFLNWLKNSKRVWHVWHVWHV